MIDDGPFVVVSFLGLAIYTASDSRRRWFRLTAGTAPEDDEAGRH